MGKRVTLITGDVVTAGAGDIGIEPAARDKPVTFQRMTRGDQEYVIPGDASELVAGGKLDQELFNVTGLIRQRYDDAHTDSVPLLIEQAAGLAGARTERSFGELNLAAVSVRKGSWRQVADSGRKIWLNARLSASLDVSVPQIGAPAAWQAGQTGEGVTVAVLDTGVDATHPDLAGKVAVAKDFSGTGSTDDIAGHGTHVASTIVGGDAKYRGVAPGARLAIGKVLDDRGNGQLDDIIEGMRWAASEAKAKVVNLSLGGRSSDGTDPGSRAVNELSKKYGTLFVVSAGNSGTFDNVSSPASADAALAVGSITKAGAVSDFSSRGPRAGDAAMKPEITAPGSDIVAARAKNSAGDGAHISHSGTSMSAPHVAGAAAILAGRHPDWTGGVIKAALVSTTAPVDAHPYSVGSGRVDIARAITSPLQVAPASVSANLTWPETKPRKNIVTYRNTGPTAVTLSLGLELKDSAGVVAPAALAKLSTSTLTIAPGASAPVTITSTPRSGRPGQYAGTLVATTVDGLSARAPVSVQDEVESYDLTVTALDRAGRPPASTTLMAVDQRTAGWTFITPGVPTRLPAGKYTVMGDLADETSLVRVANPEVDLKRNTTIKFDARQASRVSVSTDQPTVRSGYWTSTLWMKTEGSDRFGLTRFFDPRFSEVYGYSTPGVSSPRFTYFNAYRLEEPELELFAEGQQRYEVSATWQRTKPAVGTRRAGLAHGGQGRPEDLAGVATKDKMVVLELPDELSDEEIDQRIANVAGTGAWSVALNVFGGTQAEFPKVILNPAFVARFAALAKSGGEATLTVRDGGRHRYELAFPTQGRIPANLNHTVRTADLAAVTTRYYGQTEEAPPIIGATSLDLAVPVGTSVFTPTSPSKERVEYFTPGKWRLSVFTAGDDARRQEIALARGSSNQVEWNRAVLSPAFTGTTESELGVHPWAFRRGGILDIAVPFYTDTAGHTTTPDLDSDTISGTTTLYKDGQLLGTQNLAGKGTFWVGQSGENYRLVTTAKREQSWWPLSTKVESEWAFQSFFRQGPFDTPLPLLTVRAEPPVNLENRAPNGPVEIPLTVTRQDGSATITAVSLEFSTDDGTTWQQAVVSRSGDRWQAGVTNPGDGFVSLRTKASDSEGGSVAQTIIRAYQIR